MVKNFIEDKWKLSSIEYTGLGNRPYFILVNNKGEIRIEPVEKGITNLRTLLNLEEE